MIAPCTLEVLLQTELLWRLQPRDNALPRLCFRFVVFLCNALQVCLCGVGACTQRAMTHEAGALTKGLLSSDNSYFTEA